MKGCLRGVAIYVLVNFFIMGCIALSILYVIQTRSGMNYFTEQYLNGIINSNQLTVTGLSFSICFSALFVVFVIVSGLFLTRDKKPQQEQQEENDEEEE